MRMNNRDERKANERRFLTAFAISVFLHVLLVAGSLYLHYLMGLKRPQLKTIDVSLVTLQGPGSPDESDMIDGQVAVPEAQPEPEPDPPAAKPPVQPEPEKKSEPAKKIPKKVADEPEQSEPEPKEPKQDVSKKQPSDFERTLERLREKVRRGPPSNLYKRSGPGRFAQGDGEYGAPMGPEERYLVEVVTIIRRNWSFTPQFIRENGEVRAYVALTIDPGGVISNITLDRGSVSKYFNDTVVKAIEKSSPLPPVPQEVSNGPMRIGLVFTPQGIE